MGDTRPLHIGLDAIDLGATEWTGTHYWTYHNYRVMLRDNPHHRFTLIWPFPSEGRHAHRVLSAPNAGWFTIRPRSLWRRAGRRLALLNESARAVRQLEALDVLLWTAATETCFPWLHKLPQVPKVAPLMDAVPLSQPQTTTHELKRVYRTYYARVREIGSRWVTISEHAHEELVRYAGLDPALGSVVYCGHNYDGSDGAAIPDGALPDDLAGQLGSDPYVLIVSTLEPRKNHVRLFRAFGELVIRPEFARWKLVVVGRLGWVYDEILTTAAATPGVILAGRRSPEDLAALYRHAAVFALPSLYEGFGLPVAEALSFGLPVLTSNTSSLPEVAGNAAILVDPYNGDDIREALGRLMGSPELRARLAVAARSQACKFSWDRSGRELMRLLELAAADRQVTPISRTAQSQ